jgi:AAA+ superfamily predicted ATPase
VEAYRSNLEHLKDELSRLDGLLQYEVARVRAKAKESTGYEGLLISDQEIDALQSREPFAEFVSQEADHEARQARRKIQERISLTAAGMLRLPLLVKRFGLGPIETDILLLALAPELDLRYQKIYAYLQDNAALKSPAINLILRLVCSVPAERSAVSHELLGESSLVRDGLLHVRAPNTTGNFLESTVTLNSQAHRFLLGCDGLDSDLSSICRWSASSTTTEVPPFGETFRDQVRRFAGMRATAPATVCLLYGADQHGRMSVAQAICNERQVPLLVCDIASLLESRTPGPLICSMLLELRLRGASLFCDSWHLSVSDNPQTQAASRILQAMISSLDLPVFLSSRMKCGHPDPVPAAYLSLKVPGPDLAARKALWRRCLADESETTVDIDRLAALPLSQPLIEASLTNARLTAEVNGLRLSEPVLMNAAHELSRPHLISFATRVRPRRQWVDLILPKDTTLQLREFCGQVKNRDRVQDEWGFGQRFSAGKGVIALFAGATGTGKTLAAEVIASDLGLDLYRIDLASIVSKYVGETEKNLARVFQDAESSKALLFFDEADALFGKRSDVKEAHDRYANIEINYLLQRLEDYEGTIILASNLSKNIDPAFLRRLNFSIDFPFPDEEQRHSIWRSIFPAQAPLSPGLDLALLARNFRISGGNIRNIAVAAAFQAADNGGVIDMDHVILALKREYQKLGRVCDKSEFQQFYELVRS